MLPKYIDTNSTERTGIDAVAKFATARKQIWRETVRADVGIDGHLENVTDSGFATGRMVGVQVKSGKSFFQDQVSEGFRVYPNDAHKLYWESYPLPVLYVIHDPDTDNSFWLDVRQALRRPDATIPKGIIIPSSNILQNTSTSSVFETAGTIATKFIITPEEIVDALISKRFESAGFSISFFDLFALGLTNICRSIYFGMDLACGIVSPRSDAFGVGMGIGRSEHDFLFDFVRFLVAQHLAHIDFADCLIDWNDREMQPHFVAPLTDRGRQVVRWIGEREDELVQSSIMPKSSGARVAQEAFFEIQPLSILGRYERVDQFQAAIRIKK